ncbi:MAG: Nif3-like dinuclear metal center hexameric protein [Candidatus Cloacimonetes bacterium 4572_55]|nr:MAG: Nif3-like dinuclear metal center hexameric protein [Candidatus Cloacimonetes bacterium 4572_55]
MNTTELVNYLNELLNVENCADAAYNGLQVGNGDAEIEKVAFAVDACLEAFQQAAQAGAQLLVVHHGLMWNKFGAIVGISYKRIKYLLDNNLALYSAHLPMDLHAEFGHNAQLAELIGLQKLERFGEYRNQMIGFSGQLPDPLPFSEFCRQFEKINQGQLAVVASGKEIVRSVGILSGGGAMSHLEASEKGIDVLITGETSHSAYHLIKESGVNVIFAGHYHSEKPGLHALRKHIERKFRLKTLFLNIPTGF